jgi:hypothetical protein
MTATTTERFTPFFPELGRLAATAPLALAGAGATRAVVEEAGARLLTGDPVTAAHNESQRS